jgi:moderate conductance mechanosensitive channel
MHLLSQGPTQLAGPAALPLVAGGLLPDPGSMVASMGELLVAWSLKVAAVLLGAVVLNRLLRWLLRRLVGGLEHRYIQQPLESLRAKTPRALLASTDPLPSLRRSQRAEMIGAAAANVASVAIWLAAAILVLHVLGLRLGPLLAGAGIAGLVLSLSAQQMVRDFLSGIAMLMEDQYGPGDVVDAGPAKGVVERVGLRTTRLRAVDGIVWHVRNGEIERLGNESRDWARVLVDVEVARGADLAQARRTVERAGHQVAQDEQWQPFLLETPEVWGVEEVKPASVTIRLAVKTRPSKRDDVARQLRASVEGALERAGIPLPAVAEGLLVASSPAGSGS